MRILLTAALLTCPLFAAQSVQEELTVVFRDVRLHVVDEEGQPVFDLKPEDFVVLEDKEEKKITYFEEVGQPEPVRAGPGAPVEPETAKLAYEGVRSFQGQSNVVIVLDSSHLRLEAFDEYKVVIRRLITEYLGENDLVKLVQIDDRMVHLSSFVKNKGLLLDGLSKAEYKGALLRKLRFEEAKVADAFSFYLDDGYGAEEAELLQNDRLMELREAVRTKQLIKRDFFLQYKASMEYLSGVLRQMSGTKTIYLFTGGGFVHGNKTMVTPSSDLSKTMGRTLNSSNVTVYSFIHVPRKSVFHELGRVDQVRLTDRMNPIRELGSEYQMAEDVVLENVVDLTKAPLDTSDTTGGLSRSVHRLADIQDVYDDFVRGVSHYYRLGYTLESPKKKSKVKVQLAEKRKGWKLFYGKRFEPVRSYIEMGERERAVSFESSLMHNSSFRNDFDCSWGYTGFKGIEKGDIVPVYIEMGNRPFPAKGYEVGFAALNDIRVPVDFSKSTVLSVDHPEGAMFYDVLLPVAKPSYIRYQIIDLDTGEKSLFELPYERKDVNRPERFHIGGMAMAADNHAKMFPLNHLRQDSEVPEFGKGLLTLRKVKDPFAISNRLFMPASEQSFPSSKQLHLYFQLNSARHPPGEYSIVHQLLRNGKEATPSTLAITEVSSPEAGVFRCRGAIQTDGLKPGDYKLLLRVQKGELGEKAASTHEFTIIEP